MRSRAMVAIVSLGVASCGSCKHPTQTDAGALPAASDAPSTVAVPAPLSLPIASDIDPSGRVYVAGFVAARSTVNLSRFDDAGRLVWNVDALDGLTFSPDAQLDVLATSHGAAVTWRGIRHGKRTRVARWVSGDGAVTDATFDFGSSACAVGSDIYWLGGKGGTTTVMMREFPTGPETTVYHVADGVDPTLVCGTNTRAWVAEEGDDLRARPMEGGKALTRVTLVGEDDLGDDDIRDHDEATTGDMLDTLVVSEKNRLIIRSVDGALAGPKRVLDHALGADEGLMAFDGNASRTVAVLARDANTRCDGDIASDVVAIDVPRVAAEKERTLELAHGDCGQDLGPYWVAPTTAAVFVAWAVRAPRTGSRGPVDALVWTKLDEPPHTISLSAENVVFAGCHAERCAFATLARPEGTDGMTPGEAKVLLIP